MTIAEFLDKVDWSLMRLTPGHETIATGALISQCPMAQVFDCRTTNAVETAAERGLSFEDALVVANAADNYLFTDQAKLVRADMLRRMASQTVTEQP